MTKLFLIQPVGETTYGHLNKPVNNKPHFLTGLTNQKKIPIRDEHSGKIVSEIVGLFYQDGGLWGLSKDKLDLKNRGVSPIYKDIKIKEFEDYIEPISANIESVDIVDNPRNHETFLYNSATVIDETNNQGGDNLGNEGNLLEQIGALKTEVNNSKKAEEAVKGKLTAKENEYNNLKTKYDALENKYKNYESKEANSVEAKAIKLAEGDEDLEKLYKEMSLEQLNVLESKKQVEIDTQVEEKSKELAQEDEDLTKILSKLSLEDLDILEKANKKWDEELAEKYANDTGYRGAGAGQRNGYNANGSRGQDKGIKTREDYNNVVGNQASTQRPVFNL